MPFPPPMPNALTTSAFPSPVVSRSSRTPPRAPDTATSRSPFSRTTMWRDGPIDSATTSAQKPGWSVSPALSGAQTGFRTCGVEATSNAVSATTRTRDMREYPLDVSCENIQLSRSYSEVRSAVPQHAVAPFAGCNVSRPAAAACGLQAGSRARRCEPLPVHAADGGSDLQLRRAGVSGDGDVAVSRRPAPQERLHRARRDRRDSDRVGRHLGIGEAGHLPRLRPRRHPAGFAETRRRLSRAADRGRTGPRRRPQLGAGGEHHGGARREKNYGARTSAGDTADLAGRSRGARRHQGVLRARRRV